MKDLFCRREFLKLVGGSSPLLFPIFYTLRAEAQTNPRKKLVFLHWSNGWTKQFTPKSFGNNFQNSYVLSPLNEHKQDLTVLHRLNTRIQDRVSHTTMNMLTGAQLKQHEKPKGPSIDEYLGKTLGTPLASLKLNVDQTRTSTYYNTMSWRDNGQPINMIKSPRQAYDFAFKNFKFPNSIEEQQKVASPAKILEQNKSIIDLVRSDYQNLKRHLSSTELSKFESHFDLFRTLEKEIEEQKEPVTTDFLKCEALKMPSVSEEKSILSSASVQKRSRIFAQIAVAAMACDRTDVVCILMSEGVSALKYPHLNGRDGIRLFDKSAHHPISHYYKTDVCSDKITKLGVSLNVLERMKTEIDKWHSEEMAYLVSRMKEFDIFKNSYVLAGNDMGDDSHASEKSSFVSAGSLGGFFKTNFAKDYKGSRNINHTALLAAILEGFGRKGETFGYKSARKPALKDIIV